MKEFLTTTILLRYVPCNGFLFQCNIQLNRFQCWQVNMTWVTVIEVHWCEIFTTEQSSPTNRQILAEATDVHCGAVNYSAKGHFGALSGTSSVTWYLTSLYLLVIVVPTLKDRENPNKRSKRFWEKLPPTTVSAADWYEVPPFSHLNIHSTKPWQIYKRYFHASPRDSSWTKDLLGKTR